MGPRTSKVLIPFLVLLLIHSISLVQFSFYQEQVTTSFTLVLHYSVIWQNARHNIVYSFICSAKSVGNIIFYQLLSPFCNWPNFFQIRKMTDLDLTRKIFILILITLLAISFLINLILLQFLKGFPVSV